VCAICKALGVSSSGHYVPARASALEVDAGSGDSGRTHSRDSYGFALGAGLRDAGTRVVRRARRLMHQAMAVFSYIDGW